MQCQARHTIERKNVPQLKFENKPKFGFFLPTRCKNKAETLCDSCLVRQQRIPALLEKWKGTMQNQSEQVHGLIGEAIPEWSRIYKGPYYLGKIEAGWNISAESERIAEEAYTATGILEVEMPRKRPVATVEVPPEPKAPEPVVTKAPVAKPKKKTPEPIAALEKGEPVEVITVKVKATEIDGRTVYLSSVKDKVYDMKYNYLGRYNRKANKIESAYGDSDAEI
jgi:hypothetical protein